MDNALLRQRDILTPEDLYGLDVEIVGAGALGGAILLCLCKMGFGLTGRLTVTDFDVCEPHNLGTQWFRPADVLLGQAKVDALRDMVAWITEREIGIERAHFTGAEPRPLGRVVILAVDGLAERRGIWRELKQRDDVYFLVDARMGAEVTEIFCVDLERDDFDRYERSLEDAGEPYREPCTRRAVLYTVLGAASFVGSILRGYARREPFPRHVAFDFRHFFLEVERPASPDCDATADP